MGNARATRVEVGVALPQLPSHADLNRFMRTAIGCEQEPDVEWEPWVAPLVPSGWLQAKRGFLPSVIYDIAKAIVHAAPGLDYRVIERRDVEALGVASWRLCVGPRSERHGADS